jgi:alpha-ribazole phosphatase
MTQLYLVRHGITRMNEDGRLQGQSDLPLNPVGQRQAEALAARLARVPLERVIASDLRRAVQTAQIIAGRQTAARQSAGRHHLAVEAEPCLRELHFGDWEGLSYQTLQEQFPQELAKWRAEPYGFAPPGGESLGKLAQRVADFYESLASYGDQANVLVVAHGGPLQVLLCLALKLPAQNYWQFHLEPASLSQIGLYPQGAILNLLNDTSHLTGIPNTEANPWAS